MSERETKKAKETKEWILEILLGSGRGDAVISFDELANQLDHRAQEKGRAQGKDIKRPGDTTLAGYLNELTLAGEIEYQKDGYFITPRIRNKKFRSYVFIKAINIDDVLAVPDKESVYNDMISYINNHKFNKVTIIDASVTDGHDEFDIIVLVESESHIKISEFSTFYLSRHKHIKPRTTPV